MYVNESIRCVLRLVSEALAHDGEACIDSQPELLNTERIRAALELPEFSAHPLFSNRVEQNTGKLSVSDRADGKASKIAFLCDLHKYMSLSKTLADIVIGVLVIEVPRIRTLCGGTGPSFATFREWSVFDADSIMEYSRESVDGFRALLMIVKKECGKGISDALKTVKGMTELMVTRSDVSIAREQIDGVTRQMEDLVEIAGEQAGDHLRPFVKFCVCFLNTLAAASALTPKSSPDERSQCVTGLKWLLKNWPLAELTESQMSGLDSQDLKDFVANATRGIEKSMDQYMR